MQNWKRKGQKAIKRYEKIKAELEAKEKEERQNKSEWNPFWKQ